MFENGMPMALRDAGGNVNVFGDMTIVHTQTFGPRNAMNDMAKMMLGAQSLMNQRQALMIEQQKLALEQQKLELYDKLVNTQALGGPATQDTLKIANATPIGQIASNVNEDDIVEVESQVITSQDVPEHHRPTIKIKSGLTPEPENVEYVVADDRVYYDFSINADYINLNKFFDPKNGKILPNIKEEIEDATKSDRIKIRCAGPGKPAIVFMKCPKQECVNTFWRDTFREVFMRYQKSVIKNQFITPTTDFVIFIMDNQYEFIDVINLRPVPVDKFCRETSLQEHSFKAFVNWIADENTLIKNHRIRTATIVTEPILYNLSNPEYTLSNTDTPIVNLNIHSALSQQRFNIDVESYKNTFHVLYAIH